MNSKIDSHEYNIIFVTFSFLFQIYFLSLFFATIFSIFYCFKITKSYIKCEILNYKFNFGIYMKLLN